MATKRPAEEATDRLEPKLLLQALRAVKRGDFSTRLPDGLSGVDGQMAAAFNDIVEMNESLTDELSGLRVAVGAEGNTKQRISMEGSRGGWGLCVSSVNALVEDISQHTAEMARVVSAVSKGDLTQTIDVEGAGDRAIRGDFLRYARMVNGMVEQLSVFGSEVTRVAREVGVEGKLGAQARVKGVSGTWKELTDNVNLMADNLTNQVRDIAAVTTAVAQGDLTKKVAVEVKGEILKLKNTVNTMVDQLSSFASEVTRVARDVGTEGVLGGQADVKGVSGTWRELTDNVNSMANNLTNQVRNIAEVTTAIASGDLNKKIMVDAKGEILDLKNTINSMVEKLSAFGDEVTRIARDVGTDGVLGGQADVPGASGLWRDLTDNVNSMANNLTSQVRNIAEVTTAVAEGDLSRKITVDAKGEILELKNTINTMVDKLQSFSAEVSRVSRLVGTEGTLGVQAEVKDVSGVWKDLTDNVNQMADNLTGQVRAIAQVTTAVARGELTKKITVDASGEILELKNTINTMVDQLSAFAAEVTRVAREVGTEGMLGGQAEVEGASGTWKELTKNVNHMATNLTNQVRNIATVTTAVAKGDLSQKITVEASGEILELRNTINTMVDQLSSFAGEVTRVAREVGTEGQLGGQAEVEGVSGTWKELTQNVNQMANNLTGQVRNIAEVTTAVAKGDLSQKITVEARGEIQELKNTINTMVDKLSSFSSEVTRVSRLVGIQGQLGVQAEVKDVYGTWRELTDNVNMMANNLTSQVRNIADVTTAVANGDLTKKITVDAQGEILELRTTINTMVDQLSRFAAEVTRVAREVGTEGQLGGQATVLGVSGTWKELTDNVNLMANNLTGQVRNIAEVTTAVANGDLTKNITVDAQGEILELRNTINTMVHQLSSFAAEVTRVAREVGTEGQLGGQAEVKGVSGTWKELTDNVNLMATNLTSQVRNIAEVTTAVARGDLTQKISVEARGEILELRNTINTMVDQLSSFAAEVTRVAREVGTQGQLGGQADVRGVAGTWRELTDNVNLMASNLTGQVRGIAKVVTAIAEGDLTQGLTLEASGEIATLADTINDMVKTLATFAEQVTSVAREVGVEGKLGAQAEVPGAAGIWRDLTNNVNELARNLTSQVRAIGDVATAVTKGDLTRSINVEARGEVADLKDNVNQMITTLAETTKVNQEQDWLKTNLTKFTRMLQGQRDLLEVAKRVLSELALVVNVQHGAFFMAEKQAESTVLKLFASYAYKERKNISHQFKPGEGLVGQAALEKQRILLTDVPGDYIQISSGLGQGTPLNIVVVPILFETEVKGIIELASFQRFTPIQLSFLEQLLESLGIVVATIEAQMRTDELLKQSQGLTEELQTQQEELQQTNEELEEKARQLGEQKTEVERKNQEVEQAKQSLEEKAEQLALTSKYKSEFLANMSHELRTPLNSLLILSRQLSLNADGNLSDKQCEYAGTIHASGEDLLSLINEILDLAKIESGTISLDSRPVSFSQLADDAHKAFSKLAEEKQLEYLIKLDKRLPRSITTDAKRLQQVLRNLLSNAFKFTEKGSVTLEVRAAQEREWSLDHPVLSRARSVIGFSVTDTGIGIPQDKQRLIFEAFQQADGGTSRRYGGTGLGLSISRELATLLGGELRVESTPGKGSRFTLYLPETHATHAGGAPVERIETGTPAAEPAPGVAEQAVAMPRDLPAAMPVPTIPDDRNDIDPEDRSLLVIEDDERFASILLELAREKGFKCLLAQEGAPAVALARKYQPSAITLDLRLPDIDGWVVLDRLKHDPSTRHIPIHIISAVEEAARLGLRRGAIAFWPKPVQREQLEAALGQLQSFVERGKRHLLIVEDDDNQRDSIVELIGNNDVETTAVASGEEALEALRARRFDCMVLDLRLPDMSGFDLIRKVKGDPALEILPIIVYTGQELTREEETELREIAETIIVKDVKSPERLLDETALFLHRVEARLPEAKRRMLKQIHLKDPGLAGKKVLVVDDDVRNIFAITSILERHEMLVLRAENGKDALARLVEHPDIDIVLMDIMMPDMDGYEATRSIRKQKRFNKLPIIALTAKAMKGDREKCIEAGASDYIAKPVDSEQLASLLRVWLYR